MVSTRVLLAVALLIVVSSSMHLNKEDKVDKKSEASKATDTSAAPASPKWSGNDKNKNFIPDDQ